MTDHWSELNLRMERAFQGQKRASESRSLRDHFAAAALTGLLAQGDDGSFSEESYVRGAYRWADAMLREREPANHDAAPEATAGTPGTGDTPEPLAWIPVTERLPDHHGTVVCRTQDRQLQFGRVMTICTYSGGEREETYHWRGYPDCPLAVTHWFPLPETPAGTPGTGDTPKPINDCVSDRPKPIASEQEPVAWGVAAGGRVLATSIHRIDAADMQSDYACDTAVVPLYRSPTLTDAEREAVGEMAEICDSRERLSLKHQLDDEADHWRCRAVTLRGILTRTGGEK